MTVLGLALGYGGSLSIERGVGPTQTTLTFDLQVKHAEAGRVHQRRQARRVARRTARRVARRTALPPGCIWRRPYHYCGGIYYSPIVENDVTVYIVLTP